MSEVFASEFVLGFLEFFQVVFGGCDARVLGRVVAVVGLTLVIVFAILGAAVLGDRFLEWLDE